MQRNSCFYRGCSSSLCFHRDVLLFDFFERDFTDDGRTTKNLIEIFQSNRSKRKIAKSQQKAAKSHGLRQLLRKWPAIQACCAHFTGMSRHWNGGISGCVISKMVCCTEIHRKKCVTGTGDFCTFMISRFGA